MGDLNVWKLEEIQAVGLVYRIIKIVSMKSKIISISVGMLVLSGLAGCQGIKASVDNAQVKAVPRFNEKGEHSYDENGMPEFEPEVSVPVWSSRGLKETPRDLTPAEIERSKYRAIPDFDSDLGTDEEGRGSSPCSANVLRWVA